MRLRLVMDRFLNGSPAAVVLDEGAKSGRVRPCLKASRGKARPTPNHVTRSDLASERPKGWPGNSPKPAGWEWNYIVRTTVNAPPDHRLGASAIANPRRGLSEEQCLGNLNAGTRMLLDRLPGQDRAGPPSQGRDRNGTRASRHFAWGHGGS
jgi:hypothetical protein